jgi:hypothetical protein
MRSPTSIRVVALVVSLALFAMAVLVVWKTCVVRTTAPEEKQRTGAPRVPKPVSPMPIEVSRSRLENGRQTISAAITRAERYRQYSLVVDKTAYSLHVYDGDSLVAQFPVELGGDPVNPKERLGDSRTPEGSYTVTWRRDLGQTIFHRALLLDYPNHTDRRAGRTGSHIEIHGYGSGLRPDDGGSNWTDGCIALSNAHVDSLFALGEGSRRIDNGTPVTIVYAGTLPDERYLIRDR